MVYVANLTSCAAACDAANNCVAASLSGFACYLKSKLNPAKRNSGVNAVKVISRSSNTTTVSQSSTVSSKISSASLGSVTTNSTSDQISSTTSPASSSIATSTSFGSSVQAKSSTVSRIASAALASSTQISTSPVCPSDNGTLYVSTNGDTYLVECYGDRYGHDMNSVSIPSLKLADCINACSANPGCVDVSLSGSSCYMKYAAGDSYNLAHQIRGARRISVGSVSVGLSSTSGNSTASSLAGIQTQTPTLVSSAATVSSTSAPPTSESSMIISSSYGLSQSTSTSSTISRSSASLISSSSSTSSASSSTSSSSPTLGVGQSCSSASQCQTGHCILGRCSYQSQDGRPCTDSNDCKNGVCNAYRQCSFGAAGVGCHFDSDLASQTSAVR